VSRAGSVRVALLAAAALFAVGAQPAGAAGTPIGAIRWVLALDRHLSLPLSDGCLLLDGADWHAAGSTRAGVRFFSTGVGAELAGGAWSPATGAGSLTARGDALLFNAIPSGRDTGKPFKLSKVGLELADGRVYLTGQIRRIKPLAAAAPARQRLAVIAHPKLLSGPMHDKGKPPIPDTFLFAVQGRATITKALATALRRAQCTTRFARAHRVRAGAALGEITAQLLPTAATGLAGTVDVVGGLSLSGDDGSDVAVVASGGPTRVTVDRNPSLRFPLASGTAAPLVCDFGVRCVPARGAALPLAGQLTLSYGGRSTVVAGLVATYAPYADVPTVTGMVDGAPVTVADPNVSGAPDDFLARVGGALGTTVFGELGHVRVHFTATGPV
jgi:hypothetical protein